VAPWFKAIIILAWLAVPVAGSLFMRASYANYIESCDDQRQNCELRAWHVDQYSRELNQMAAPVLEITSREEHARWLDRFKEVSDRQAAAEAKLDAGPPAYYQATDRLLLSQEVRLQDQFDALQDAALARLDYLRSMDRLGRLYEIESDLKANAYYYKRVGMQGIYLQIQENLAVVEDEIRARRDQRANLQREYGELLDEAADHYRNIQRGLDQVGDKISEDESQTFRGRLVNHVLEFSLRKEIAALAGEGR